MQAEGRLSWGEAQPREVIHPSSREVKKPFLRHNRVVFGRKRLRAVRNDAELFCKAFHIKEHGHQRVRASWRSRYLEAFFPQGYISACGDATLRHDFNNVWARLPSSLAPSFVAVPGLLESGLEQQQATHTMLFTL